MATCLFSGKEADIERLQDTDDGYAVRTKEFGEYFITNQAIQAYKDDTNFTNVHKMKCLQESIQLVNDGFIPFWTVYENEEEEVKNPKVVFRTISSVANKFIDHKDKEKKILSLLSSKLSKEINPFKFTRLSLRDLYGIGVFEPFEFVEWINYLEREGLIEIHQQANAARNVIGNGTKFVSHIQNHDSFKITVKGWEFLRNMNSPWNSRNVFIAMAFTDQDRKELPSETRDCIKKTLESLEWKPLIVDEIHHNDGIMDKVISSINDSRFIIAELTWQKTGVYYEAGYAKGKGLPVIHVVKKDDLINCHFDVKHLNLIVWSEFSELEEKLKNRIKATIL